MDASIGDRASGCGRAKGGPAGSPHRECVRQSDVAFSLPWD
jgi:hypothetical protein